ncbi:SCO2523 family variant P-loop protein [Catenulispora yoronensis]|uniref:SCO2523 family variant P-loop protein n=1 Tax=Catenulispora yoronensis TaxID=450799 RepID=A0ABP5GMZ4_9ACTN
MLVFAASDKGGSGRSVTSCNMAYRRALQGDTVAYLDFDFGSPTAGAILDVPVAEHGVDGSGLHSYFTRHTEARQLDTALHSESGAMRDLPSVSSVGRLVLLPGDRGGGEFAIGRDMPARCAQLFLRLDREFDCCVVDLSAGRSYALDLVLEATARPELAKLTTRWLVFHRWTKQHIVSAHGLVFGEKGILHAAERYGHDPRTLNESVRYVRTAVVDLGVDQESVTRAPQGAWLRAYDSKLREQADRLRMGRARLAGQIPYDPMLQWSGQVIDDSDVRGLRIANEATVQSFEELAARLSDERFWEGL